MPAKVSDSVRATVTAGLAKLVDDVNQYAPPIHAPTAKGTADPRPVRTQPWITNNSPTVAITSESHSAPEERSRCDRLIASSSNIRFASIVPTHPPIVCATAYSAVSRVEMVPSRRSTSVTIGLKCAPAGADSLGDQPADEVEAELADTGLGLRRQFDVGGVQRVDHDPSSTVATDEMRSRSSATVASNAAFVPTGTGSGTDQCSQPPGPSSSS